MSKKAKLITLTCVVVALFALYFIISAFTGTNSTQQTVHTIYSPAGNISQIYIKSANVTLNNNNNNWVVLNEEDFPVNDEYVQSMINEVAPLIAITKVTQNIQQDEVYGFDKEYNVITFNDDNGQTKLIIGDINTYTGDTYVKNETTGEIFTANSQFISTYNIQKENLQLIDIWPITSPSQVQSVYFTSASLPLDGIKITIERADDEQATIKYNVSTKQGEQFYSQNDPANILISTISSLYITESENYSVQPQQLADYGLENPLFTLELIATGYEGEDLSVTMHVGNVAPSGGYYVNFEGSAAVNVMDGLFLSEIINTNEQTLKGE